MSEGSDDRVERTICMLDDTAGCRESLTDRAYAAIKQKILSVELPPGAHFTEAQLSVELSLSKTPVREALARLQREDLVDVMPRSGYRVTPVTLKDVRDLFVLRVLLEGEAVRLAAGKEFSQDQLRRLEELCHIEYVATDPAQLAAAITDNTEFHVLLASGSGNPRLVSFFRKVMEQMERVLHIGVPATPRSETIDREHGDLLRGVLSGDGERAREIVVIHSRAWQDRMIDIFLSSEAVLSTNLGECLSARSHLSVVRGPEHAS